MVSRASFAAALLLALLGPSAAKHRRGGGGSCQQRLTITTGFSKLDVNGDLNEHPIELDKKEEARPEGDVLVKLSIPCPQSNEDLAEPFTFTLESAGSTVIEPQKGLTIKAARVVRIDVDHLQLELDTPGPIQVTDSQFKTPDGLHMEVTSGTAEALGHQFDLVGFEARVPFNGYFTVDAGTGELTLHITDFDANFVVKVDDPQIDGHFAVKGWITALSGAASSLRADVVGSMAAARGKASPGAAVAHAALLFSGLAVATAFMVAAVRRAHSLWRGEPLRDPALATDSTKPELELVA